jgi:hypothetical protein
MVASDVGLAEDSLGGTDLGVDVVASSVAVRGVGVSLASAAGRVVGVAVMSRVADGATVGLGVGAWVHAARVRARIARNAA